MPSRRSATGRTFCAPEAILQGHTPEVQAIAQRARALVLRVLPEVEERGYPGWKLIGYRVGGAYVGFVAPLKDHVRLGFERGVLLEDPEGLLEGDGTQVRYVPLWRPEPLPEKGIARLLQQAVALSRAPMDVLHAAKSRQMARPTRAVSRRK
jgi:hypothetical protein